jgi:hypothetical protein
MMTWMNLIWDADGYLTDILKARLFASPTRIRTITAVPRHLPHISPVRVIGGGGKCPHNR